MDNNYSSLRSLIGQLASKVLHRASERPDNRLVAHSYAASVGLVRHVEELGEGFAEKDILVATAAAWCAFTGFPASSDAAAWNASRNLARQWLTELGASPTDIQEVDRTLSYMASPQGTPHPPAALLADAYAIQLTLQDYELQRASRKLEQELTRNTSRDWPSFLQMEQNRLMTQRLHTHKARVQWEPILGRLIQAVGDELKKSKENHTPKGEELSRRPFQDLERKVPLRAMQTFFRSNYRNHINLSAIADGKANIMISVNSILISVLITVLSYRNIGETNPEILLPTVIFLITGLASLICAVLSAQPKVTRLHNSDTPLPIAQRNSIFFGNFVGLGEEKFEQAMDAMFRDGELLYGNMVRDLYQLGVVLDKKYRYLSASYTIFLIGFVTTVLGYLFTVLT